MNPTRRLYLEDDYLFECEARVLAVDGLRLALDQSCFYPGGGGQPPDTGQLTLLDGRALPIEAVSADEVGLIWLHSTEEPPTSLIGQRVLARLDVSRRLALMRYHTVLHVLNTSMLRAYDAWITGVQMAADYARIDFKIEGFSPEWCPQIEAMVNAVIAADHTVKAYTISAEDFEARPDLLRTLVAQPPVKDGRVRVVEIVGFDAQACGGTHVHSTRDLGRFRIERTENKGRINKRFYIRLDEI